MGKNRVYFHSFLRFHLQFLRSSRYFDVIDVSWRLLEYRRHLDLAEEDNANEQIGQRNENGNEVLIFLLSLDNKRIILMTMIWCVWCVRMYSVSFVCCVAAVDSLINSVLFFILRDFSLYTCIEHFVR